MIILINSNIGSSNAIYSTLPATSHPEKGYREKKPIYFTCEIKEIKNYRYQAIKQKEQSKLKIQKTRL